MTTRKQDRRLVKALEKATGAGVDALGLVVGEAAPIALPFVPMIGEKAKPVLRDLLLDFADLLGIDTASVRVTTDGEVNVTIKAPKK